MADPCGDSCLSKCYCWYPFRLLVLCFFYHLNSYAGWHNMNVVCTSTLPGAPPWCHEGHNDMLVSQNGGSPNHPQIGCLSNGWFWGSPNLRNRNMFRVLFAHLTWLVCKLRSFLTRGKHWRDRCSSRNRVDYQQANLISINDHHSCHSCSINHDHLWTNKNWIWAKQRVISLVPLLPLFASAILIAVFRGFRPWWGPLLADISPSVYPLVSAMNHDQTRLFIHQPWLTWFLKIGYPQKNYPFLGVPPAI